MVTTYIPDSGDLVWVNFDPQAGREQAGMRPALILSPRSFHLRTSLAIACPITSKSKGYAFEIALPHGLPVHGTVMCEHMRSLDWQTRIKGHIGKAPDGILLEVREIIGSIIGVTP